VRKFNEVNIRVKLIGLISLVVAVLIFLLMILSKPSQSPSPELDLIQPTNTLSFKNLEFTPTRIFPSATPILPLVSPTVPMENQVIYLIQLKGLPDPEQRRHFVTVLNQTLNRPVEVVYEYGTVYNGLAVKLTPQEAVKVAKLDEVRQVLPDSRRYPQDQSKGDTDRSNR
jgi:hypothetical protein